MCQKTITQPSKCCQLETFFDAFVERINKPCGISELIAESLLIRQIAHIKIGPAGAYLGALAAKISA
jgi:hypothetical protein